MSKDTKKKKLGFSTIGWIIWILAAVVLVIIFIANKNRIAGNLKATGFFDRFFGKTPDFIANVEVPDSSIKKNDIIPETDSVEIQLVQTYGDYNGESESPILYKNLPKEKKSSADQNQNTAPEEKSPEPDDTQSDLQPAYASGSSEDEVFKVFSGENQASGLESAATQNSSLALAHSINPNLIYEPNTTEPVKSPTENPSENVNIRLYFIEVDDYGHGNVIDIPRLMKKTSTPLTDAINALIDGPTPDEQKKTPFGCKTVVSPGTRLLSASVKNGIATLNFSEEFEFNNYGVEGLIWQLRQIVYTATAFPNVEKVQFLIEGTHREYVSEGLRIGEPLSRDYI